jgi:hypothetical protein
MKPIMKTVQRILNLSGTNDVIIATYAITSTMSHCEQSVVAQKKTPAD